MMIKKLLPKKGFAWRIFGGDLKKLIDGLSEEPKRIQAFLKTVVRESNPGTAIDTQEEWYQQFGLPYKFTKSTAEKQAETLERYVALGDQDIVYLQDQVEKAGFTSIVLGETTPPPSSTTNVCGLATCGLSRCWNAGGLGPKWIFHYTVTGTVDNDQELDRLKALLQKIAQAHLVPIFSVISSNNICGPARCGVAVCDG
jgi:hypothetical protein